jgi:hypothetical protein
MNDLEVICPHCGVKSVIVVEVLPHKPELPPYMGRPGWIVSAEHRCQSHKEEQ